MEKYCFGVDLGGTTIKFGLFTVTGSLLEKWEIPTRTEDKGSHILEDIASSLENCIRDRKLDKKDILGVGIDVPGPVNEKGLVLGAVNLYWTEHIDLKGIMEKRLGLPVKGANDGNAAALGEMWQGAGMGCKNLIMITLGTGVGGGIIVDGKILAGSHGAGGEIGHANLLSKSLEACNCGNRGCLEQGASATGIQRLAELALKGGRPSSLQGLAKITAKDVLDAWKAGDEVAGEVVKEFGEILGNAISIFTCVLDPDKIIIGGGVSKAGEILLDQIRPAYKRDAFPACKETPLVLAKLGNDAGIFGAARMMLD